MLAHVLYSQQAWLGNLTAGLWHQVVASVLTRLASQARVPIPASRYASGERRVEAWMDSIEKGTG